MRRSLRLSGIAAAALGLASGLWVVFSGPAAGPPTPNPAGGNTVTDGTGRIVSVVGRPERIVSTAPAMTEILFAVGAGPRVVGVTTQDDFPPDVAGIAKVGGFGPNVLKLEVVLGLRPDLVVSAGGFMQPTVDALAKTGVPVYAAEPATFAALAQTIRDLGTLTDCAAEAGGVATGLTSRVRAVAARAEGRAGPKPTVLVVIDADRLIVAGPPTFLGQMVALAGGANALAGTEVEGKHYPAISDELVLRAQPTFILVPGGTGAAAVLARRPGWHTLDAVTAGRVRPVPESLVSRPGPRLVDGLEAVAAVLRGD